MKRLAILPLLALAACESQEPPVACGPIPQVIVNAGETANVTACFNDPNGDMLVYSATSSNPGVATASMSGTGITVAAVAPGSASVTVTASDPGGLEATQSFQVLVPNRAPVAGDPIEDIEVFVGDAAEVDAAGHFAEPDGETLAYSATSSNPTAATVSVSGSVVTVAAVAKGGAIVTVTATDPGGLAATQTFEVTVTLPDREVLVALYEATDGPNWRDNTNWLSDKPLGEWYGVSTDADGRVVRLHLGGYWDNDEDEHVEHGLRGEIPPELGDLSNLEGLYLDVNSLTGEIPPELGNLSNLDTLYLDVNSLTGEIPPELGNLSNLEWLSLARNSLTGEIPPELGNLSNLGLLELGANSLTGSIPPELGNLSNLEWLWLDNNSLTGEIPSSFLAIGSLSGLYFQDNNGLCAPNTSAFTTWLNGIDDWSGPRC